MNDKIVDFSRWPIVVVTGRPGPPRGEHWNEIIDECLERAKKEDMPFAMVFDVRPEDPLSAADRKLVSDHIQRRYEDLEKWFVCEGNIMASALQRAAMTAIMWVIGRKMPFRLRAFSSFEEAFVWVEKTHQNFVNSRSVARRQA